MPIEIERYDKDTAFRAVCAATIAAGQLVGLDASGNLVLADADAATPIEAVGVALTAGVSGNTIGVAQDAQLKNTAWSFAVGSAGKLWLSGTAGGMTTTRPTTATNLVQAVGRSLSATRVIVRITPAVARVQADGTTTVNFSVT